MKEQETLFETVRCNVQHFIGELPHDEYRMVLVKFIDNPFAERAQRSIERAFLRTTRLLARENGSRVLGGREVGSTALLQARKGSMYSNSENAENVWLRIPIKIEDELPPMPDRDGFVTFVPGKNLGAFVSRLYIAAIEFYPMKGYR